MSPQFVKPYVKSQKNDSNDAEAICEAVSRPGMRFVHPKTIGQQDLQGLHRIRQRRIHNRTALINQIRGLLMEYGITLPRQVAQVRRRLPSVLEGTTEQLTSLGRELFEDLYRELVALDEYLLEIDRRIKRIFAAMEPCQRLAQAEQNGIIERFFRSLKEECVWQHQFPSFPDACRAVANWIRWYNEGRPHQTLGYLSPRHYRTRQLAEVI